MLRGASEHGPRALGHRSILANPIDPKARDTINNKFKKRMVSTFLSYNDG